MCHFQQKLTKSSLPYSPICSGCESLADEFCGERHVWSCLMFDEVLGDFAGRPVRCSACESEPD